MLEFYQAYTRYREVIDLTQQLMRQARSTLPVKPKTKSSKEVNWAGSKTGDA